MSAAGRVPPSPFKEEGRFGRSPKGERGRGRRPPSRENGLSTGGVLVRAVSIALLALASPALAQLRGHGGPVRALAVSPDGRLAMSGSFDQSAILWAIDQGVALAVLRFHEGAVNAVAALPDGRFATGSEDGRIALWRVGATTPDQVVADHRGPV